MTLTLLALSAALLGAPATLPATSSAVRPAPSPGEALIQRMYQRYAGKWYRTLTFVQKTTRHNPADPSAPPQEQIWYEAGSIPGKLRIDVAPLDSMNVHMYVGDSAHGFRRGERQPARKDRNLLMTLGFDVYGQPAATTIAQLREEGIDLAPMHEATWKGRPVYVVGAAAGDTTTSQFWIEKERLVVVRLIQRLDNPQNPGAPPAILDVEFNDYRPLGKGWIAPQCIIKVNGREVQREDYSDIRADVKLPADLFDTQTYRRPGWVTEQQ